MLMTVLGRKQASICSIHHRHHCVLRGTPSIRVAGQCRMKYTASSHDVICAQLVHPSHETGLCKPARPYAVSLPTGLHGPAFPSHCETSVPDPLP
jgi:hypothetical protein